MSGAGLIGNWQGMARKLGGLGAQLNTVVERFPGREAVYLVSEIKKGIISQSPGGKAFQELADSTIKARLRKKGKKTGGSPKALIDTGVMLASVTTVEVEKGVHFVGLLRTQMHVTEDGTIEMANLGEIHEYGTKDGHIPARPFIGPTVAVEKPKMRERFTNEVMKVGRW